RREVHCDLHMRPASIISGHVRVPGGWKVEEADVKLEARTLDPADVMGLTEEPSTCDAQGKYAIKSLRRGELLVRAELPGLLPTAVHVSIEPGKVLELPGLVLEESRCATRGRVDLPQSLRRDGIAEAQLASIRLKGFGTTPLGILVHAQRGASPGATPAPGALEGAVLDARTASRTRELRGGCPV